MRERISQRLKICLVGENAVGKTCLIRKYVLNEFSDDYIITVGTKSSKKEITIQHPITKEPTEANLIIWDIMGVKGFRKLFQDMFFYGAQGIIAVCDNTRENTLLELEDWIDGIYSLSEGVPIVFLGNKCDLENMQEIGLNDLSNFASRYDSSGAYLTSAKTGLNVDLAFQTLTEKILENTF